jgi:hypothetical protein
MKVNIQVLPEIEQDSLEYEQLREAVRLSKDVEGFTCEIGIRGGGGSFYMMETLVDLGISDKKVHIAVDPFGNIEYASNDNDIIRQDYTNSMKQNMLLNLTLWQIQLEDKAPEFLFFPLEDTEFFKSFADGVPIYKETKTLLNKYSAIHLDGPHSKATLWPEIDFFHARTDPGAVMVFDDINLYDHQSVHEYVESLGWKCITTGDRKASYQKS